MNESLNCEQANRIDIVDLLERLGFKPAKISRQDYWYRSPLRDENTASFKINREKNVWYDHGTGEGGTMVDFAVKYFKCGVAEALQYLDTNAYITRAHIITQAPRETPINIVSDTTIHSLALTRYLAQRNISADTAQKFCREICFSLHEKQYKAIGFRNDKGGFELRNSWFKGSSSPKTITTLLSGAKELFVFEGFFDFLSFKSILPDNKNQGDFLILNSASFFERCRQEMDSYQLAHLYLDNDITGRRLTNLAITWGKMYRDESNLYKGYKDLNEWVQSQGKKQHKGQKL